MGEKILYRDRGGLKVKPGSSPARVRQMLGDIDAMLKNSGAMSDFACMELYCIWNEATRFLAGT
jgi:hypothetical protein